MPLGAHAQPSYAPNEFAAVEDVAHRCPGLIRQDHAFTDAVATVLNRQDARWGRNGKRGNPNDPSHDAIFYRNASSPIGGAVIDVIVGAGGPNPGPAWIDQTQATIDARTTGVWVAPSGVLPPCLSGHAPTLPAPGTGPGTPAPPAPTAPVDLAPLMAALQRIEQRLISLEARPIPDTVDMALVEAYITDMVGDGPGDGAPNHVTDILQRQDRNLERFEVLFEQLNAWLRSRTLLRR